MILRLDVLNCEYCYIFNFHSHKILKIDLYFHLSHHLFIKINIFFWYFTTLDNVTTFIIKEAAFTGRQDPEEAIWNHSHSLRDALLLENALREGEWFEIFGTGYQLWLLLWSVIIWVNRLLRFYHRPRSFFRSTLSICWSSSGPWK